MNFKELTIEDKKIFDRYIKPYYFKTSEYSFTNLYIWRRAFHVQYTILDDSTLIIMKRDDRGNYYFMEPIGYEEKNLHKILNQLMYYVEENDMVYLFRDAEEPFIQKLKEMKEYKFIIEEDRDNFDYIYESQKLISLTGKKLHSKKNHVNTFIRNYDFKIKFIDNKNAEDVNEMATHWVKQNYCVDYLYFELKGVQDILNHIGNLDFDGMAVYIDNKVEAFTFGERVNKNMAIIHIEKANVEIDGLYSFVNNAFIKNYYYDVPFINREQDLGVDGLRKAKLSYQPYKLEKKFIVKLI